MPTKKQNAAQLKIRPEAVRGDILDRLLEPINADQRSWYRHICVALNKVDMDAM